MQTLKTPVLQSNLPLRLALRRTLSRHHSTSLVGGGLGLLAFFFLGLLPSLLLGGSVGAQLARALLGTPTPGFGANALIVLGVVSATFVGASLFTALGVAAGAAVSALTSAPATFKAAP